MSKKIRVCFNGTKTWSAITLIEEEDTYYVLHKSLGGLRKKRIKIGGNWKKILEKAERKKIDIPGVQLTDEEILVIPFDLHIGEFNNFERHLEMEKMLENSQLEIDSLFKSAQLTEETVRGLPFKENLKKELKESADFNKKIQPFFPKKKED